MDGYIHGLSHSCRSEKVPQLEAFGLNRHLTTNCIMTKGVIFVQKRRRACEGSDIAKKWVKEQKIKRGVGQNLPQSWDIHPLPSLLDFQLVPPFSLCFLQTNTP